MSHKTVTKLALAKKPTPAEAQAALDWEAKREARKQEEESWTRTPEQIAAVVKDIRHELEQARQRYDGAMFDAVADAIPRSMDVGDKKEIYQLVEALNPCLEGFHIRVEKALGHCLETDDLGNMHWQGHEYAFQLGMFAGFIFAGASDKELDRLERALVHATAARHWEVKAVKL